MGDTGAHGPDGRAADEGLDALLRELHRQAARGDTAPDPRRILNWLHRHTGTHTALVDGATGRVDTATAGFPHDDLEPLAALLSRLSAGSLDTAATQAAGRYVRLEALGPFAPRPVLVAVSDAEPPPHASAALAHAAGVLALLHRAGDVDRTRRGYQAKAHQVRFAVLQALLSGDALLARRMTTGAVPPILEAGRLRLHLLHCLPADRERIVHAMQDPSGYHGPDLIVQCPVFKEHLICLIADDGPDGEATAPQSPRPSRAADLHRLVEENTPYALGVSDAHPLTETAAAYTQAAHALSAARTVPDRVAHYHGRTPLEGVLPQAAALGWARTFLQPLEQAPRISVDIARLALWMPRTGVAKLLDMSRNTVAAHIRRVESVLAVDLGDIRVRAAVHLALALDGAATARPADDADGEPVALGDLFRSERAAAWARTRLRPLAERNRRTLEAWVAENADAQQAARLLGISRNTVRAHLRAAESELGLDLLTLGSGIHEVVHALQITASRAA
ncbi:PucR family transcriptional regulator [Streptomyces sp. SID5785]|uniref:helix-turn-helix domain-containing protein n=1 Tax=Streptomyces sp. SID5785 TaxID=2690309 RepID=UPI001361E8F1|nr:helix-turn-helix domain-containing protein [Streptomyces sp. SID5785]MZD04434.1 PucR family transcriptional regulator [Streptomyces sp. SID5785]